MIANTCKGMSDFKYNGVKLSNYPSTGVASNTITKFEVVCYQKHEVDG